MKEEKMMILSMLEEGKITSEEAIKLMEALDEVEIPRNNSDFTNKKDDFILNEKKEQKSKFNTLEDLGSEIGNVLGDMGSEIGNVLGDMFNGLKGMGSSFGFKTNYETITTNLDLDLSDIENPNLDFKAVNGSIKLRPTDGDKLLIKVICQYKNGLFLPNELFFNFSTIGNKIVFSPKYNSNISIKLDVLLPEKNYGEIVLNSTNGKIDIDDLSLNILECMTTNASIDILNVNAQKIDLSTKNGRIECRDSNSNIMTLYTTNSNIFLMNIESTEIQAKTSNAKISINDINAESIICKTSNSSIEAMDIACDTVYLTTSNGRITCDDIDLSRVKHIQLIASNGSISSDIHSINREIYLDLETSMGNINLELPNLIYKTNKQINLGLKKIEAHSVNYDENKDHLKFVASTSNGSIKIS